MRIREQKGSPRAPPELTLHHQQQQLLRVPLCRLRYGLRCRRGRKVGAARPCHLRLGKAVAAVVGIRVPWAAVRPRDALRAAAEPRAPPCGAQKDPRCSSSCALTPAGPGGAVLPYSCTPRPGLSHSVTARPGVAPRESQPGRGEELARASGTPQSEAPSLQPPAQVPDAAVGEILGKSARRSDVSRLGPKPIRKQNGTTELPYGRALRAMHEPAHIDPAAVQGDMLTHQHTEMTSK